MRGGDIALVPKNIPYATKVADALNETFRRFLNRFNVVAMVLLQTPLNMHC